MNPQSFLRLRHLAWAVAGLVVATVLGAVIHSGAKSNPLGPPLPVVEVATVEQKDVPAYGEWIGTLAGQGTRTSRRRLRAI